MFIFHGGCTGCNQQSVHGDRYCMGCRYFDADWSLPNLSSCPPSTAELRREQLKAGAAAIYSEPATLNVGQPCK